MRRLKDSCMWSDWRGFLFSYYINTSQLDIKHSCSMLNAQCSAVLKTQNPSKFRIVIKNASISSHWHTVSSFKYGSHSSHVQDIICTQIQ